MSISTTKSSSLQHLMDKLIGGSRIYVLFNSISVISEREAGKNKRLFSMERFLHQRLDKQRFVQLISL